MTIREAFGKLAVATAKGMKNPFFVIKNLHKEFKDIQDNVTSCGLVQDAKDIDYDNTASGLTGTNAQTAIDELAGAVDDAGTEIATIDGRVDTLEGKVDKGSVSVTADGVKDYATLFGELQALCDFTKVNKDSVLKFNGRIFQAVRTGGSYARFTTIEATDGDLQVETVRFQSNSSYFNSTTTTSGTVFTKMNTTVPTTGTVFELLY